MTRTRVEIRKVRHKICLKETGTTRDGSKIHPAMAGTRIQIGVSVGLIYQQEIRFRQWPGVEPYPNSDKR